MKFVVEHRFRLPYRPFLHLEVEKPDRHPTGISFSPLLVSHWNDSQLSCYSIACGMVLETS